jgi:hypothetical protein
METTILIILGSIVYLIIGRTIIVMADKTDLINKDSNYELDAFLTFWGIIFFPLVLLGILVREISDYFVKGITK